MIELQLPVYAGRIVKFVEGPGVDFLILILYSLQYLDYLFSGRGLRGAVVVCVDELGLARLMARGATGDTAANLPRQHLLLLLYELPLLVRLNLRDLLLRHEREHLPANIRRPLRLLFLGLLFQDLIKRNLITPFILESLKV